MRFGFSGRTCAILVLAAFGAAFTCFGAAFTCFGAAFTCFGGAASTCTGAASTCTALLGGSLFPSTGTGSNCAGGPSGLGDNAAFDRSIRRNSSARYSSAIDGVSAKKAAQRTAANTVLGTLLFRAIQHLLKRSGPEPQTLM